MVYRTTFQAMIRRLKFVQQRVWDTRAIDGTETAQITELNKTLISLRDQLRKLYGPKIAREIEFEKGEL